MPTITIGCDESIRFADTKSVVFNSKKVGNCIIEITAVSKIDLSSILLTGLSLGNCNEINPSTNVLAAFGQLQCQINHLAEATGTVTNVDANDFLPLFTTSVATPTSTPVISFAAVSQNQNLFYASPDGAAGIPSFRTIQASDLPAGIGFITSVADTSTVNLTVLGGQLTADTVFNNRFDGLLDTFTYTGNAYDLPMVNSTETGLTPINLLGSNVISVVAASTTALPAFTYNNGAAGVGATITINAVGALPNQDGISLLLNNAFLYKSDTNQIYNGVYTYTTVGNGGTQAVLRRATNSDTSTELTNQVVIPISGTVNKNIVFSQQTESPVIGTDDIVYDSPLVPTGGGKAWLRNLNNVTATTNKFGTKNNFSVDFYQQNTLVGKIDTSKNLAWGTASQFLLNSSGRLTKYNNAAPTDGQLLIGDTAAGYFKAATLTQGAGITITNGAGGITIANSSLFPLGTDTQTIRYSGATPTANSILTNDGTNIGIGVGATISTRLTIKAVDALDTTNVIHVRDSADVRLMLLTDTGGVIIGKNTITNFNANINIIGATNIISTASSGSVGGFVFGTGNTLSNSVGFGFLFGGSNSSMQGNMFLGFSNVQSSGAGGLNFLVGNGNSTTTATNLGAFFFGDTNSGNGGYVVGRNNISNLGFGWGYTLGDGNTMNANGITGVSDAGGTIIGYNNVIAAGSFTMGQTMVLGSGITMASNVLNSGTINLGWNTTTGNRPALQFKSLGKNILLLGTDVTQASFDTSAVNAFIMKSGTSPTTNIADTAIYYVADITAGNAAPHFRLEGGDVVQLYKNTAVTTPQGIADALTNLGLLATSTIVSGGGGTVTSVALALPTNEFTISGSPVTTTGTLTGAWKSQNQNLVFASPDGSSGTPAFRALVAADIPSLSGLYLTIDGATTGATSQAQAFTNGILVDSILNNTTADFISTFDAGFIYRISGSGTDYLTIDPTNRTYILGRLGHGNITIDESTPLTTFNILGGGWAMDGTTLYPITDGSNIGLSGTNRIGTIYMASTIDYVTNMNFSVSGVNQVVIDSSGNFTTGTWAATTIALNHGGTGSTTASGARTNLGATTVGSNIFTVTNPSAITFLRVNADNSVSLLDAATFRTAIGAGTGSGTVTSVSGTTNRITSTGGATPVIDISATFEALLGKVANPLSQFASTTSAQLSSVLSDETGTGVVVYSISPALTGSPTAPTQTPADNSTKIATTAYVDNAVLGQRAKEAVKYASTAALPSIIYANGSSGVGATLTGVALAAISLDGNSPSLNDRILIKNQVSTFQNGIYTVTQTGSGIAVFILTRSTDFDQASDIQTGDIVFVTSGNTLSTTTWTYTGGDNPVMGTDPITWAQTAGQGSFTAGNGISITGTSIAIDTNVTVDKTTLQTLSNKTFVTPVLGAATATSINGNVITTGTGTLTLSTFTLTVAGTASISGTNTGDQTIAGLSPLTTKGDVFTYSTINTRLGIGADATIFMADAAATTGNKWIALSGDVTVALTGVTAIGANKVTTTTINAGAVTYAKIQNASANTFLVNNTGSGATLAETTYNQSTTGSYSGTIVWSGTGAPTTIVSNQYWIKQIGSLVTLTISLVYSGAGTANTGVQMAFPAGAPAPVAISGTTTNDKVCSGFGWIDSGTTGTPPAARVYVINAGSGVYNINIVVASSNAKVAYATIIYSTN